MPPNIIMRKRFMLVTIIASASLFAGCGVNGTNSGARGFSMSAPGSSVGSPVHVTNINQGSVSAYLLDQTSGALQRIGGSPFSADRSSPAALVVKPAGIESFISLGVIAICPFMITPPITVYISAPSKFLVP